MVTPINMMFSSTSFRKPSRMQTLSSIKELRRSNYRGSSTHWPSAFLFVFSALLVSSTASSVKVVDAGTEEANGTYLPQPSGTRPDNFKNEMVKEAWTSNERILLAGRPWYKNDRNASYIYFWSDHGCWQLCKADGTALYMCTVFRPNGKPDDFATQLTTAPSSPPESDDDRFEGWKGKNAGLAGKLPITLSTDRTRTSKPASQ